MAAEDEEDEGEEEGRAMDEERTDQNDRRGWQCHHSTQLRCQLLYPSIYLQHRLRHTVQVLCLFTR